VGKNPYHVKFGEKMETFIYPGVNTYTWWGKVHQKLEGKRYERKYGSRMDRRK